MFCSPHGAPSHVNDYCACYVRRSQRYGVLSTKDLADVASTATEQVIAPMIDILGSSTAGTRTNAQRVVVLISTADVEVHASVPIGVGGAYTGTNSAQL